MNQVGVPIKELEQLNNEQQLTEIPSYPGEETYQPQQETYSPSTNEQYVPIQTQTLESKKMSGHVNLYNTPENQTITESSTPELQTNISIETTLSGEKKIFVNPELGQSSFHGGITSQQLVSKVAGYYTVHQGLVSDPKSGLLQKTANSGDPTSATTWQSTMLFKILQAFWAALGIG